MDRDSPISRWSVIWRPVHGKALGKKFFRSRFQSIRVLFNHGFDEHFAGNFLENEKTLGAVWK